MDTYQPSLLLKPFIKSYLVIDTASEMVNRVLPDTSLVMAFRYRGKVDYVSGHVADNLAATAVSGLRKSARLIHYTKDTGNILVIFKEAGAHAFIHEPVHELFDESIALHTITGYKNLAAIEDKLAVATDHKQRIHLIDQFLLSKLSYHKPDQLILAALDKIRYAKGIIRIKELANTLCISQDAFEKRFRRVVGTSPKQFSNIIRMRFIVSKSTGSSSLAELAFDAGYFDQPHFNKDFKLFTGQTPTDFLQSPVFW